MATPGVSRARTRNRARQPPSPPRAGRPPRTLCRRSSRTRALHGSGARRANVVLMTERPFERPPTVVIVGGGFGGLAAEKALRASGARVVMVDRANYHTFQPLLYQVATAGLDADDIAYSIRGIVRKGRHTDVRMATVTGVD